MQLLLLMVQQLQQRMARSRSAIVVGAVAVGCTNREALLNRAHEKGHAAVAVGASAAAAARQQRCDSKSHQGLRNLPRCYRNEGRQLLLQRAALPLQLDGVRFLRRRSNCF